MHSNPSFYVAWLITLHTSHTLVWSCLYVSNCFDHFQSSVQSPNFQWFPIFASSIPRFVAEIPGLPLIIYPHFIHIYISWWKPVENGSFMVNSQVFTMKKTLNPSHLRGSAASLSRHRRHRPGGHGRAGRGVARGATPGDAAAASGAAAAAGSGWTEPAATRKNSGNKSDGKMFDDFWCFLMIFDDFCLWEDHDDHGSFMKFQRE